ncbi:Sialin [Sarcoptes scabiei]|nr:Sialin [Sarcoptes scabiei]
MTIARSDILKLYRDLLRYSRQLKYSDIDYINRRIRNEFRAKQNLTESKDIEYYYQKGLTFLNRRSLV